MSSVALEDLVPVTAAGRGFIDRIRVLADAERTTVAALVHQLDGDLTEVAPAEWLTVVLDSSGMRSALHDE